MANKVELCYQNEEYSVIINGSVVETSKDIEKSFEKFKQVIKNNSNAAEKSWLYIEDNIREFNSEFVEINSEFKTISLGSLKYFYNTGKTFYIDNGAMTPLTGGYDLIKFILNAKGLDTLEGIEGFLDLCKIAIENRASYRTTENSISIFSAILNYGSVEYNFSTGKMNKGVAIEPATFEEFKKFTVDTIGRR